MGASIQNNMYHLLAGLWRQRYLVVTPMLLMPILGLLLALAMPKQYQSHTTLLVQEATKLNPLLADLAVESKLEDRLSAVNTLLHSRHILGLVSEDLGLVNQDAGDAERDEVIEDLSKRISVSLSGSELIKITLKSPAPDRMADTLKSISQHYIEHLLAPEESSVARSESFLERQLNQLRDELIQAEKRLADYKREKAVELPQFHSRDVDKLRELEERLSESEAALSGARAALASLNTQLALTNPVVGTLEKRIVELSSELTELRARYTEQHSRVQATLRKLKQLEQEREQVRQQVWKLDSSSLQKLWDLANAGSDQSAGTTQQPLLVSQLQALQQAKSEEQRQLSNIAQLKRDAEAVRNKVNAFARIESDLQALERDIGTRQKLYNDFLQRYEMSKVTSALGQFERGDRVKIIDTPFNPTAPINPPGWLFFLAGLVGGLAMGIGMATVVELSDSTIRRRETLTQITGVPVLARIPCVAPAACPTYVQEQPS